MRAALPLVLLVLLTACATAGTSGTRRDHKVIERDELVESNQMNALDLIRSARPHWLRPRGVASMTNDPEIMIYLDGVRAGGPEVLAEMPLINIETIRFYDAREAQFRFGVGHLHGAIEISTRRG